jgi:predicted membrane channel-forming protein YqfA (hemolysin III family)
MNKRQVRYGIYACLAAMVGAILYAFIRLYGLNQRVGIDIIVVNVVVFTISAGVMVYLSWKQRDIEQEELFGD